MHGQQNIKILNQMSLGTLCDKRFGDSQKSADQNFFFSIFATCLHFGTFSNDMFIYLELCLLTRLCVSHGA